MVFVLKIHLESLVCALYLPVCLSVHFIFKFLLIKGWSTEIYF